MISDSNNGSDQPSVSNMNSKWQSLLNRIITYTPYDNFYAPMSTHFDPLVGWNAVSGSYWLTRDYILVVGAEAIVA